MWNQKLQLHGTSLITSITLLQTFMAIISAAAAAASPDSVHLELISWGTQLPQELHIPTTADTKQQPVVKPSFVLLLVNDTPWTAKSKVTKQSGRFSVRAPRGHGLMVVLQMVNLRVLGSGSGSSNNYLDNYGGISGGGCRDYVKFSDSSGFLSTPKICGTLNKEENRSFTPESLVGPRVFHSPSGRIEVSYESDNTNYANDDDSSNSNDGNNSNNNQVVEMVFTAYSECLLHTISSQLKCGQSCISELLACDDQLNCAFEEDFGRDERNCNGTTARSSYGGTTIKSGGTTTSSSARSYLLSLYVGAFIFVLILVGIGVYHRHTTYMRIKNIPT